ncbi:MAG: phage head-tail joining protein [Methylobacter sp.]
MAFTQTQLNALEAAIAQGALSVQFGERRITYHSLDEMIRLRDTMRSELGVAKPAGSRSRIINIATGKGL